MEKKFLIIIVGSLLLVFFMGLAWFVTRPDQEEAINDKEVMEIEKKYNEQNEQLEELPEMFLPPSEEVFSFSGEIIEVQNNVLKLRGASPFHSPMEEEVQVTKLVTVTDHTELVKEVEISEEDWIQLQKKYIKAVEACDEGGINVEFPHPFKFELIEFNSLKVGARVLVEADKNIKGKSEFNAVRVVLRLAE